MNETVIHCYEVELTLSEAPSHGIAQNGFHVAHKLRNGQLFSGQYEFESGIAEVDLPQKAKLNILLPNDMNLVPGESLELYNPVNVVGRVVIKKFLHTLT